MRVTRKEFRRLVRRAVEDLPPYIQDAMDNVAILVEDEPGPDVLGPAGGDESHGQLLGLYTGVPLPERDGGTPLLPDTITLFQRPIQSACDSKDDVVREVRTTLVHEVGHYLGMSEDDLERLGYG